VERLDALDDRDFERLCSTLVGEMGFALVSSRFSGGVMELEADFKMPDGDVVPYFIQFRRGVDKLRKKDVDDLVGKQRDGKELKGLLITTGTYTKKALKHADETGVNLADGEQLGQLLRKYDLDSKLVRKRAPVKVEPVGDRYLPSVGALDDIIKQAKEFCKKKDYKRALGYYEKALDLKPNYDEAWRMKGVCLKELGKAEDSLGCYVKALEYNVENEEAWFNMGEALYDLERYEEEVEAYLQALRLDPDFVQALNNLGATLHLLGRYDEAVEAYKRALDLDPEQPDVLNNIGVALNKLGVHEAALECFDRAIKLNEKYRDAHLNRIETLIKLDMPDETLTSYAVLLKLDKKDEWLWYDLGETFLDLGYFNKAIYCFRRALKHKRKFPEAEDALDEAQDLLIAEGDDVPAEPLFEFDTDFGKPGMKKLVGKRDTGAPAKKPKKKKKGKKVKKAPKPPVAAIHAASTSLNKGETTTLEWAAENAGKVVIEPYVGEVDPKGSIEVSPEESVTYIITAIGPGGEVTAEAHIVVEDVPAPSVSLYLEDASVKRGGSTVLSWSSEHADTLAIEPDIGEVEVEGSRQVSPGKTTTFRARATGPGGTAEKDIVLKVLSSKPKIKLSIDPPDIEVGGKALLAWSVSDADKITITPDIGEVDAEGKAEVSPKRTTEYLIRAHGSGGKVRKRVTLEVFEPEPEPTLLVTLEPARIEQGGKAELSWKSENADKVTISPGFGEVELEGKRVLAPHESTRFRVTATGPGGSVSEKLALAVAEPSPPPTLSVSLEPEEVERGESAVLAWSSEYATEVFIEPGPGKVDKSGTTTLAPIQTTNYVIKAVGPGGEVREEITLEVLFPAPTLDVSVDRDSITPGEEVVLTWKTENAQELLIEPGIGGVELNGELVLTPEETTKYGFIARGARGEVEASVVVMVTEPEPEEPDIPEEAPEPEEVELMFKGPTEPEEPIPDDVAEIERQAVTYLYLERYEAAESWLNAALAKSGDSEVLWNLKGAAQFGQEHYDDALVSFKRATDIDPNYVAGWRNKYAAYAELEMYEEALHSIDQLLRLTPRNAKLLAIKGTILRELEDIDGALDAYKRALDLDDGLDDVWMARGAALQYAERLDEALPIYEKALRINPGNEVAWNNRGSIMFELQRYEDALECFEKASALFPGYAEAWNNQAAALLAMKQADGALAAIDKALEHYSDSEELWNHRSAVLFALGREDDAVKSADKALKLNPELAEAHNNKGLALAGLGKDDQAVDCFNAALELEPDFKAAAEYLEAIEGGSRPAKARVDKPKKGNKGKANKKDLVRPEELAPVPDLGEKEEKNAAGFTASLKRFADEAENEPLRPRSRARKGGSFAESLQQMGGAQEEEQGPKNRKGANSFAESLKQLDSGQKDSSSELDGFDVEDGAYDVESALGMDDAALEGFTKRPRARTGSSSDTKRCPRCNGETGVDAEICIVCGWEYNKEPE